MALRCSWTRLSPQPFNSWWVAGDHRLARIDLHPGVLDHRIEQVGGHLRIDVPVARLVAQPREGEPPRQGARRRGQERHRRELEHRAPLHTASESEEKVKSVTFNAGNANAEPMSCSEVITRRVGPIISVLRSIFTGVSFQRKFFTARETLPFSTRK